MPAAVDIQNKFFDAAMNAQAQLTMMQNSLATTPCPVTPEQWDAFLASMASTSVS